MEYVPDNSLPKNQMKLEQWTLLLLQRPFRATSSHLAQSPKEKDLDTGIAYFPSPSSSSPAFPSFPVPFLHT